MSVPILPAVSTPMSHAQQWRFNQMWAQRLTAVDRVFEDMLARRTAERAKAKLEASVPASLSNAPRSARARL